MVDKGRERDVECLDLHKTFDTFFCSCLIIITYENSNGVKNRLNCQAQRAVVSAVKPS